MICAPASQALADCSPFNGSNVTVNCIGATVGQGATGVQNSSSIGYGDGSQDGLTLNVQPGASVAGDNTSVWVNDHNTINNFGSIETGAFGHGVIANFRNTITNSGTIKVGDFSIGVFLSGDRNTVTNNGTITGSTALGVELTASSRNLVTNNGVISLGDDSIGIDGSSSQFNRIVNNGTITTGAAVGSLTAAIAVGFRNTVINNGALIVGNDASGIIAVGPRNTIVNNGTIVAGAGVVDYSAGIDLTLAGPGAFNRVFNNGQIIVGARGVGINTGDSNFIVNNGSVVAGPNGVSIGTCGCVPATNNFVINRGTLDGALNLDSQGGPGNTFTNSGLITITNTGTPVGANHIVDGTYTQLASGVLDLRVNAAGVSDVLSNGPLGTLTANLGGKLGAIVQPGLYADTTTYLRVVSATNPIATTFNTVSSSSIFFNANAVYNPTSVDLTLTRIPFAAVVGETQNQRAVARALDPGYSTGLTGNAAIFYGNLLAATSTKALDQISGEGASGAKETTFGAADTFLTMMMDQGSFWRSGDTNDANGATFGAGRLNYAEDPAQPSALKAIKVPADYEPRWRAWTAGFDGAWSLHGEGAPGSAGLTHSTASGAAGLDYQLDRDLLFGVAIGGSASNFTVADRSTSGSLAGGNIGAYGVALRGPWYASGAMTFGAYSNTINRTIAGVGPTETATGSFNSNLLGGRFEIGYKQAFDNFSITPFVALQFSELWQPGYSETSTAATGAPGVLGVTYGSRVTPSLPSFLGAQFDTRVTLANGTVWSPYVRVSWVHEFEPTRDITASFLSVPGASFTVDGPRAASDALRISVGSKLAIASNASLFASFDGEFSDRGSMVAGKGGAKIVW
jgi:outer membrane autotransporter protein